ncbi:MAG: hypothetical protein C0613_11730 [Desulfobulbaceae bacterium]|nr:MAG: hypothetical protein C0613_11730 [Desulfobulbaceae bacterium]
MSMHRLFLCFIVLLMPSMALAGQNDRLSMAADGIVVDNKTHLMWQLDKSRRSFSDRSRAEAYAAELRLGGYTNWRLPTLAERWDLLQVFMYKNNGSIVFPKSASRYWTAETDKGTLPIKLDISCMCRGDQEIEYKSKGYVRAVRETLDEQR